MNFQKAFVAASVMFAGLLFFIFAFISLMLAKNIGIKIPNLGWAGVSFGIFYLMLMLHINSVRRDYLPPALFEEEIEDV